MCTNGSEDQPRRASSAQHQTLLSLPYSQQYQSNDYVDSLNTDEQLERYLVSLHGTWAQSLRRYNPNGTVAGDLHETELSSSCPPHQDAASYTTEPMGRAGPVRDRVAFLYIALNYRNPPARRHADDILNNDR